MRILVWVFLVVIYISSCEKEKIDIATFEECQGGEIQDSLAMRTKLVGKWKWVESQCGFCPAEDSQPIKADKSVIATFDADSFFSVEEESKIITRGTWQVKKYEFGCFIEFDTVSQYFSGWPRLCGRELLFDGRAYDGAVILFAKVD
ncbi:MAG: hypothetical protein WBM83_01020 [Flavobacteriaceae bacterium]